MTSNVGALVLAQNQGQFVVEKEETLEMKLQYVWLWYTAYTEFGNKELLLSGNVEMKSVGYGAAGFAKFVACCSSCKFEKLLAVGGDDVVKVVFVVAVVI